MPKVSVLLLICTTLWSQPIIEYHIPNSLAPELRSLPNINVEESGGRSVRLEVAKLNPEVRRALHGDDVIALARMLNGSDHSIQFQAAYALGEINSNKSRARKVLAGFLEHKPGIPRTEFGEQFFARRATEQAAQQSLAKLQKSLVLFCGCALAVALSALAVCKIGLRMVRNTGEKK